MSSLLKIAIKRFCSATGLNEALLGLHRRDLLVLCYHGIVREPRPDRWSYENWDPAELFRGQLEWLQRHFQPTDLDGVRRWRSGNWNQSRPPVLLTFDDGYRNNLTVAAPILSSMGIPAVVFLATGYVGSSRVLWNDEIRCRVTNWTADTIQMPDGETRPWPAETLSQRRLAESINRACKLLADAERATYLDFLREQTHAVNPIDDPEARAFLNWEEARQLAAMGFEVGSHTVNHPILSRVGFDQAVFEIGESKAAIEREIGCACRAIAYPNGTLANISSSAHLARSCENRYGS